MERFIKEKAQSDYDNIQELYNEHKHKQPPIFNKLLTAQSILLLGIIRKDKSVFERGYNEVRKYQLEILDVNFEETDLTVISNNTINEYENDNAYLQICNRMKEDREYQELEYKYLMENNYFE